VRREELYTPSVSDQGSDVEVDGDGNADRKSQLDREALLRERLAQVFGEINVDVENDKPLAKHAEEEAHKNGEPEEFEFRLFAEAPKAASAPETTTVRQDSVAAPIQKIIIEPDDHGSGALGEGGFINPRRHPSYYFAPKAADKTLHRYEKAAISGEDVLRGLQVRYTGWSRPWRVTVLPLSQKTTLRLRNHAADSEHINPLPVAHNGEDVQRKKMTKPGKKRRVILRVRMRKEMEENGKKEEEQRRKEESEKEKRTRRNREKKVKKRLRDKAKKEAAGVGGGGGGGDAGGGEGSDGSDSE
jgi:hypothetical protein